MCVSLWIRRVWAFRGTLSVILPLILLPIPLISQSKVAACGYTILLMAVYWIAEVVPLAVTSFLPLVIFPISGIMTGAEVSASFFRDASWLFVGGLIIAIAVEDTGLHRRCALRILIAIGTKPRLLLFGFMSITFFLSMWISNTATTAMMLPMVEAVYKELEAESKRNIEKKQNDMLSESDADLKENAENVSTVSYNIQSFRIELGEIPTNVVSSRENAGNERDMESFKQSENQKLDSIIKGITLCIPFASGIGGTAALTGTFPNLILSGQYKLAFPAADVQLTFGNWIVYALPQALVIFVLSYAWLCWYFFGIEWQCVKTVFRGKGQTSAGERAVMKVIKEEHGKLGPIRWSEVTVLVIFVLTAFLWFFRDPGFMPGWAVLFPDGYVTDGTVAVAMSILLFILPSQKPIFFNSEDPTEIKKPVPSVLEWKSVHRKFPWGILFLFSGSYALAAGATRSGFSTWVGNLLVFDKSVDDWVILLGCTLIVTVFTQISNNAAAAAIFTPIFAQLAVISQIHPLYLMLGPVFASSMAFLLPVGSPYNAIAFSYGRLKVVDMLKAGWVPVLLGVLVILIFSNTFAIPYFGMGAFPEWAHVITNETAGTVTMVPRVN